jgi:hypothetical protein
MAIPEKLTLYQLNDMFIEIDGLADGLDPGTFYNAATVIATLKDRDGVDVPGCIGVTLSYLPASNGNYRGIVDDPFDPPAGGGYTLILDTDQGGIKGHFEIKAEVKVRRT